MSPNDKDMNPDQIVEEDLPMKQWVVTDVTNIPDDVIQVDNPAYSEIILVAQLCLKYIPDKEMAMLAFQMIVDRMPPVG